MLNILLITPGRRIHAGAHLDAILKSAVAPADLATVAALTPPEHRVEIWDEAIRGELKSASDLPRHYDIIGVGGYSSDGERTLAIGGLLKGIPTPVVVGGVGVSSEPERYRDHFDVLFIGEAEYTWPRFLSDYQAGKYETEYRQRVQNGLVDKTRTEIALVEIFYDFLTRWGSSFERMKEYHQVQLCEICDRTIARENGVSDPADAPAPEPWAWVNTDAKAPIRDLRLRRTATDVLRCVEEEFRRHNQPSLHQATRGTAHGRGGDASQERAAVSGTSGTGRSIGT